MWDRSEAHHTVVAILMDQWCDWMWRASENLTKISIKTSSIVSAQYHIKWCELKCRLFCNFLKKILVQFWTL